MLIVLGSPTPRNVACRNLRMVAKRPGKTTVVKSLVKPPTRVLRFPPLPVAAPLANTASTCGALIFGHGENMESSFLAKPPRRTCKWCVVRRPTSLRRISPFRCGQPGSLDGISFSLSPLIAIMAALQSLSENPWPWLPLLKPLTIRVR